MDERRTYGKSVIFYDGECGLCHLFVVFVLKHDQREHFLFAPLQGVYAKKSMNTHSVNGLDTIVVETTEGKILIKATAVTYILKMCGGDWKIAGGLISFFPTWLSNVGYDVVGMYRQIFFKKPDKICPLVTEEISKKFIE
jgi:predicted DCC family thiol-disulfide oxidoreductase YuxK